MKCEIQLMKQDLVQEIKDQCTKSFGSKLKTVIIVLITILICLLIIEIVGIIVFGITSIILHILWYLTAKQRCDRHKSNSN